MKRFSLLAILLVLLAGCGGTLDYRPLDAHMGAGNCDGATSYVEASKDKYGSNQQLIYLMDSGMINLYCGNYASSQQSFQKADEMVEDLWTKSITKEGASFLVNDYTIAYSGEDFEKVMINLFYAMSFSMQGDYESALVEARKLNERLIEINESYEDDEKNVYREDAFARYLSALLYEADNPADLQNLDNAAIDYERGYEVYTAYAGEYGTPVPRIFVEDYYRVAEATGRLENAKKKRKKVDWLHQKKARKMGKIVFLHLSGKSPVKAEEAIVSQTPSGPVKIAFPKFVSMPLGCTDSTLVAHSGTGEDYRRQSELVEDLTGIAVKNLEDRKGRIVAKAIARAIAKQVAVEAAAKQADSQAGKMLTRFFGKVVAAATEVADVRSWRTLPGRVYLSRLYVPEGSYTVTVEYCGRTKTLADGMEIKPGQTKFVMLEDVYPTGVVASADSNAKRR